jgi:hypothetical protein
VPEIGANAAKLISLFYARKIMRRARDVEGAVARVISAEFFHTAG